LANLDPLVINVDTLFNTRANLFDIPFEPILDCNIQSRQHCIAGVYALEKTLNICPSRVMKKISRVAETFYKQEKGTKEFLDS
jgi:hypothetical protein